MEFKKVKDDLADVEETNSDSLSTEDKEEVLTHKPLQQQDSIVHKRAWREICRLARFIDMVAYALPVVDDDVPSTYKEVINSSESVQWKQPTNERMQSLQKAIGCKWVHVKKERLPPKNEIRYNTKLVVKGYAQKQGVDCNEVFS